MRGPAVVSHQTVRLEPGNHVTPEEGMCVLELASVLAGEKFGAFPRSVCPVIGSFLRCYNDEVDDRHRKDLIRCASVVVGTRATRRVERRRARACRRWVVQVARPGFWRHPFWTLLALRRRRRNEAAAIYAALVAVHGEYPGERHSAALDLVGRLIGEPDSAPPRDGDFAVARQRPELQVGASR
jgi:hypothetical protein